jgi:hypothetical protein
MHAHEGESPAQEHRIHRHHRRYDGVDLDGSTSPKTASATLGLATAIVALCMIAVPLAGALAQEGSRQISAGRAAAIHECSILAARYSQHDWGDTEIHQYRTCMARHGQPE